MILIINNICANNSSQSVSPVAAKRLARKPSESRCMTLRARKTTQTFLPWERKYKLEWVSWGRRRSLQLQRKQKRSNKEKAWDVRPEAEEAKAEWLYSNNRHDDCRYLWITVDRRYLHTYIHTYVYFFRVNSCPERWIMIRLRKSDFFFLLFSFLEAAISHFSHACITTEDFISSPVYCLESLS